MVPARAQARPKHPLGNPGELFEVLGRMSEGLLVLDRTQRIIYANRAARNLLGISQVPLPSRPPVLDIATLGKKVVSTDTPSEATIELFFPERRTLVLRAAPFAGLDDVLVLVSDITEQAAANRIRKEFVAHASHELKSPVTGMRSLSDALARAIADDDRPGAEKLLDSLQSDLDRLSALVSDLLDLSRIEEGSQRSREPVDLVTIANREIDHLADEIARAELVIEGPGREPVIVKQADPMQIGLLVRNLLENAIRYTPEHGRIKVGVHSSQRTGTIEVSDEGIGIPSEAQARIFERFYRVDKARTRNRGGTGLGLAIVKHVAELHGGTVEVNSELGAGSTFTVRLPLEPLQDEDVDR